MKGLTSVTGQWQAELRFKHIFQLALSGKYFFGHQLSANIVLDPWVNKKSTLYSWSRKAKKQIIST